MTELFKQEYLNAALDRYKFKNLEDMYASCWIWSNIQQEK